MTMSISTPADYNYPSPSQPPQPPPPFLNSPEPIQLLTTSATAPGKFFTSRKEMQNHYKSDWHKYNLRRRSAGLSMLNEVDFTARWEAAMALRREKESGELRNGVAHRKDKQMTKTKTKTKHSSHQQREKNRRRKPAFATERYEGQDDSIIAKDEDADISIDKEEEDDDELEDENPPDINPCQSFFDNHISSTPQENLLYMQRHYSFYLPDSEYCVDLEGFLGYCNEKVRWGNICLYCQKTFKGGAQGVIRHMKDKEHCKILYERNVDMEEYDVFYDFRTMSGNDDVRDETMTRKHNKKVGDGGDDPMVEEKENEEDEEWEDVSDDDGDIAIQENEGNDDDDDELYEAYHNEMSTRGFDITPLGELIFPDGRIIGHRGLARYYKQRFAPDRMEREAVRHARIAAADRLLDGRVVNLYQLQNNSEDGINNNPGSMTLGHHSLLPSGSIPIGRGGKGILVSCGGGGFTSLSLYRYRAAVKKQRREDARGQRLQYRTRMNTNKMDKKGNNITTGVVTAKMPR